MVAVTVCPQQHHSLDDRGQGVRPKGRPPPPPGGALQRLRLMLRVSWGGGGLHSKGKDLTGGPTSR